MSHDRSPWILVLAGGSGTRLANLTVGPDGVPVPKQFCSLRGGPTLLLETIGRALALTTPDRVLVVVAAEHATWWRGQLAGLPPENVFVQPQNRGTAAGIMFILRAALERDPRARIVVMPSDHYFERPQIVLDTLRSALHAVMASPAHPILLGIAPDQPDTEYGWIEPSGRGDAPRAVLRFVEKPPPADAMALWRSGALWNSLLLAADGLELWRLCERHAPAVAAGLAMVFAAPPAVRASTIAAVYRSLPATDFSRDVLQAAAERLRMVPVPECGWTDLGTERRLAECISNLGHRAPRVPPTALGSSFPTVVLAEALHRRVGQVAG